VLQAVIIQEQGEDSPLAQAIGRDLKGKLSPLLYLAGIALAFIDTRLSDAIFVAVALLWLRPDPRIERIIRRSPRRGASGGEVGLDGRGRTDVRRNDRNK